MTDAEMLVCLARYAKSLDTALEVESDTLNRPILLGHLAMTARVFMCIQLHEPTERLQQILRVEERAHGFPLLPGAVAAGVREEWEIFAPLFAQYVQERVGTRRSLDEA